MTNIRRFAIVGAIAVLAASAVAESSVPVVRWSPHAAYKGRQITMGPTGARAWVDGHLIVVTHVMKGSPACGLLQRDDVVTGAGGKAFAEGADPRVALGDAITAAETDAGRGRLKLSIVRNGKSIDVVVPIRVMGSYGENWPFDCAKSSRIVNEACAHLAGAQYPNGELPSEVGMATQWAGLFFTASGDARYQDNARRAAQWLSDRTWENAGLNCWPSGYSGVMLAEYYLATGDRSVLPTLKKLTDFIARSQMACGSWGHNGPWGGYGAVNQVGAVCLMAMVLGKECGVEQDRLALKRGLDFFEKYAEKGWVPYGDHTPWMGQSDNGKSSIAAVVFYLAGGYDTAVSQFANCVAGSYDHREDGHTGSYFSFMWGPLAARLAGEQKLRTFLDHQRWYYELSRTWDGGVVNQPNPENLSGRTPGTYTWSGPKYTTGGMTLMYAMPRKTLRILGAKPGPFAANCPVAVKPLRDHWIRGEREAFDAKLAEMWKNGKLSAEDRRLVNVLAAVAKRRDESVKLTLASIAADIKEGDVYMASEKLKSLERLLGKEAPELADAQKLMADNGQWVEAGERYYRVWKQMRELSEEYWHYYGKKTAEALGDAEPVIPVRWTALVPASQGQEAQTWKTTSGVLKSGGPVYMHTGEKRPPFTAWAHDSFDDSKWMDKKAPVDCSGPGVTMRKSFIVKGMEIGRLRLRLLSPKTFRAKVYINGVKVAGCVSGDGKRYWPIELPKEAVGLIRKINALGVAAEGKGKFDVALEATAAR